MSRALDSTDTLALAALVVALVALLNTISQVLQQYFATADGYRRCSSSVMGDWARFTRRRFKWKELRFETIFVTPVIFLDVAYDMKLAQERENSPVVILDGSDEMSKWPGLKEVGHHEMRWNRFSHHHHHHSAPADLEKPKPVHSRTFSKPSNTGIKKFLRENTPLMPPESQLERFMALDVDPKGHRLDNEPVTWISLMQSLQRYSASLQGAGLTVLQDVGSGSLRRGRILTPAARISKKSWDFMPPEITKPLALSNLRDIVIIVQILGCKWTNFKPEEGNIRAEGDGILVTSAEVRSLGTVVSFTKTDKRIEELRELHGLIYSPFEGAVNLGFGIIQSDLLSGETYKIFSLDDCYETLNRLSSAVRDFSTMPKLVMQTIITDTLGLLTPVFRPVCTGITYVVKPSTLVSDNIKLSRGPVELFLGDTVISLRGSLAGFCSELGNLLQHDRKPPYSTDSHRAHLESIHRIASGVLRDRKWKNGFGRPIIAFQGYANHNVISLLEMLHHAWDQATAFLSAHQITCRAVLGIHLDAMLDSWQDILRVQPANQLRDLEIASAAQRQLMKIYFGVCRKAAIASLTHLDPLLVEKIWISLLFRGICWHALHNFDDRVVAVPPQYLNSNLPIYIS